MEIREGIAGTVGNTPLIRLNKLSAETGCEILGKAEFLNPGGSVKDRAALWIVRDAERRGVLKPGGTVVEAGINGTLGERTPQKPKGRYGSGGGYWVKIDHGGRWETQYLHMLEPPLVEVGQRVETGDQLGKVGSTGKSGAPHLHYEQRRSRQKVEAWFDGEPSGITTDDREYEVRRTSNNCAVRPAPAR